MTSKSKSYYKKRADRLFSLWVRQRDAINGVATCITCGTPHPWRSIHCGHFMSRRHEATRYNEENCAPQCISCNTFNQGEQFKFSQYINSKYGETTADKLHILSRMECKRGWIDYKIIGDELLEKLKSNKFETK